MCLPQFEGSRSERGATLAIVAVMMVAVLSVMALAIDLSQAYTARSELQRMVDAGSLAGASAFIDFQGRSTEGYARVRAEEYLERNRVAGSTPDSSHVVIQVIADSTKVRVFAGHQISTFFSRIFGLSSLGVRAMAAAETEPAAAATECLKPVAVPDRWFEKEQDPDGDRIWDSSESWVFEPPGGFESYGGIQTGDDEYARVGEPGATGYGSDWAYDQNGDYPGDYGRPMVIKASDDQGKDADASIDSHFLAFRIPVDEGRSGSCSNEAWNSEEYSGASAFRANWCQCNNHQAELGFEYELETGDMEGPTLQGTSDIIARDPGAFWNATKRVVQSPRYGDNQSPRIITIGLYDPHLARKPGDGVIELNNFVRVFLEEQGDESQPVIGRFLGFSRGTKRVDDPGSLVRLLRIVE
jgi:hypothetical protein